MYIGLHIKYPLYLFHFNENFSQQIFEKYSNSTFHENPYSRSQVFPCGQTDGEADRHDVANSRFSQFSECSNSFTYSLLLWVKLWLRTPRIKNRLSESDKISWYIITDPQQTANKKLQKSYNKKVHTKYEKLRQPGVLWATQSPLTT